MNLSIDCSNFTDVPNPTQLACLKFAGYTRAIVGCSDGTLANLQLAAYYAAGFEVEAYCWVSYGQFWTAKVDHALNVLKTARGVKRMWLDVEEDTPTGIDPTVAQLEARIKAVKTYITLARPDLELGIYTSRGFWTGHGDLHSFCDMPLMAAQYVTDATTPPTGTPILFGGWASAALWQYAGSIDTCGLNVDRSVILEEHMPTPEYDDLKAAIGGVFGYAQDCRKALDTVTAAFFDHVQKSGGDTTAIQAEIDAINVKLDAAAAALK